MPVGGVLRFDDEAFVAEVRYGEVVVRHYAFRDHWFKINCTTDLRGRFVETAPGEDLPPFTFNCDIATPMFRRDDAEYAVDLWLDVLVRADGVAHVVCDHDDFDAALAQGLLSQREAAGARAGLEELVGLIAAGDFIGFLEANQPFVPSSVPEAPGMERVPLGEVHGPLLLPGRRPSW